MSASAWRPLKDAPKHLPAYVETDPWRGDEVKEHPILFIEPMVRAILEGRKTQTRRPIKPQPPAEFHRRLGPTATGFVWTNMAHANPCEPECLHEIKRPFAVGDRLWVRETFASGVPGCPGGYSYRADHVDPRGDGPAHPMVWTPSIHMPRWASRITLEVTDIRPERVQAITEADAKAEGAERFGAVFQDGKSRMADFNGEYRRAGFACLWDSIYGGGPLAWANNPWVWATTFKVVTP